MIEFRVHRVRHNAGPAHTAGVRPRRGRCAAMFARADTLAFGAGNAGGGVRRLDGPGSPPIILRNDSMMSQSSANGGGGGGGGGKTSSGNLPSSIILCGKCDAFTCGQLVALGEHRALVKAWLWDIDPYAASGSSSLLTPPPALPAPNASVSARANIARILLS